jgi:predicted phosphohydrolase
MKFRLVSDLHIDFSALVLPETPEDSETVLLIAGDICEGSHRTLLWNFLDTHCHRFRKIIFILGNYGENLYLHSETVQKEVFENYHNVHFLDNQTLVIGNIAIIGSVLWTDFENGNHTVMYNAGRCMADYMWIRGGEDYGSNRILPTDIYAEHERAVCYLKSAIKKQKKHGKSILVLTHHAPTWQSVSPQFVGDKLNGAFVSDLSEMILDCKPDIWCHGHVHSCHDYMVGDTRVICNSRGYRSKKDDSGEQTGWNPVFSFEIGE